MLWDINSADVIQQEYGTSTSTSSKSSQSSSNNLIQTIVDDTNFCTTAEYPHYDAYFYDAYCAAYKVCLRFYDSDCYPEGALGMTEYQLRIFDAIVIGFPVLILWNFLGWVGIPYVACLYVTSNDYSTCTLRIFDNSETPVTAAEA